MKYLPAAFIALAVAQGAGGPVENIQEFPPPSWWNGPVSDPPMDFRGAGTMLPLYGGIPLYEGMWKQFEPNDRNTNNRFHDRDYWSRRYMHLERLRFNAMVMYHPHPYPLFVDYHTQYPEAAWLTPEVLADKQAMLRWHIAEAEKHGIKLYFLTWNIWTPQGYARAHGIGQHSVDNPEVRAYTRWTIAEFFETFPGFGGLATMAGETPVGCIDFLRAAVVPALKDITPRPRLIFHTWCAYPDEAKRVLDDYDGPALAMHYLQYEQFFMDIADPRIGMYSRDLGGRSMVALGGIYSPFLYFGDPEMTHGVVSTLYTKNNGRGLLVQGSEHAQGWLAELAYARYLNHPAEPYNDRVWEVVLASRYGSEELARPLLSLLKTASQVMPTQMMLTHSQSDHFHPHVGLSLGQMLEMPTLSTYIFENSQTLNDRGYLEGHLGLSYPNPDWGVKVLEIGHYVRNLIRNPKERSEATAAWVAARRTRGFNPQPIRGDELSPLDVVDRLENHLSKGRNSLDTVERLQFQASRKADELETTLARVRLNLAFADYIAKKDRAAIAFERYRVLGQAASDREACLKHLADSVEAWKTYAAAMDAGNRRPVGHWRFWSAAPPPYSQNDFWYGYRKLASTFEEMTPFWDRELELIRTQLEGSSVPVPPMMDELRPVASGGEVVARIGFEPGEEPIYVLEPVAAPLAQIITDPALILEGKHSLLADSRKSQNEWNQYMITDLEKLNFSPNTPYQVRIRYRVVDPGAFSTPFAVFLRSVKGGFEADQGENRVWGQSEWVLSERVLFATTGEFDDYRLCFLLRGQAALVIDSITIKRMTPSDQH